MEKVQPNPFWYLRFGIRLLITLALIYLVTAHYLVLPLPESLAAAQLWGIYGVFSWGICLVLLFLGPWIALDFFEINADARFLGELPGTLVWVFSWATAAASLADVFDRSWVHYETALVLLLVIGVVAAMFFAVSAVSSRLQIRMAEQLAALRPTRNGGTV